MKKYHVNIQGIIYEVEADSLNEAIQKVSDESWKIKTK